MIDPIEQAFGRYNVAVTTGRNVLPSANAYSALLDERQMAVERAILHHHPDVVRLVLAARRAVPILDGVEEQVGESPQEWTQRADASANSITAALDPFKEVQE